MPLEFWIPYPFFCLFRRGSSKGIFKSTIGWLTLYSHLALDYVQGNSHDVKFMILKIIFFSSFLLAFYYRS